MISPRFNDVLANTNLDAPMSILARLNIPAEEEDPLPVVIEERRSSHSSSSSSEGMMRQLQDQMFKKLLSNKEK